MKKTVKILLLEDNVSDADFIIRQLAKSDLVFVSAVVDTRKLFEAALNSFAPDIILSDYSLPAFDAVSAFQIVHGRNLNIPFIIVSGTVGEDNAVKLMKDGVTDFASKNNLLALPQKVIRALKEAEESREKADILEKLKLKSADLLLANKALVFQIAEKEKRAVELENANKELLAFNFISSHDLQEPLRKIQLFVSQITEKDNLPESVMSAMKRIQSSATRMRRLIEDLQAFSRISSPEHDYAMTDLHVILEEVKSDLKDTITEKRATISAIGLLPVNVAVFQFRQLIYNLISNSLKFSLPDVPTHITLQTNIVRENDPENGFVLPRNCDYWHLRLTDNGIGFEEMFSERVFVMFQRLHHTQQYSGTGIGLAIVKKIVDNHDGIIVAKGNLNTGAAFDIYIPIADIEISSN